MRAKNILNWILCDITKELYALEIEKNEKIGVSLNMSCGSRGRNS